LRSESESVRYLNVRGGEFACSEKHAIPAFISDPKLQKRLAKYMVLQCFRNSSLEDLHSGITQSSAGGDYCVCPII
jgi:hypothetical protein